MLLVPAALAMPPASASWSPLQSSPVKIECTTSGGSPYCRSTGVVGVGAARAAAVFRELDRYVSLMASISSVRRLEPDVLHVVMDYPFPFDDRDYVARFVASEESGAYVFRWTPVESSAAPPQEGVVRLSWLDGEWRFAPDGENTRVTYTWQSDPGGGLPDVGAVRRKAGSFAIQDIARACSASVIGP